LKNLIYRWLPHYNRSFNEQWPQHLQGQPLTLTGSLFGHGSLDASRKRPKPNEIVEAFGAKVFYDLI
jgi:hypothetical protein